MTRTWTNAQLRRGRLARVAALPIAAALVATPAATGVAQPLLDTDDEWPLPNQDYANTRAAPDSAIDSSNVDQLGVAWSMPIPGRGPYGAAAGGLVIDEGVVFFQDLGANVFAITLEDGSIIWEQRYDTALVGPTGPAIDGQHVFTSIDDATFAALDITTGEEIWTAQPDTGYLGAIQATVHDGTVYYATQAGKSGDEGYAAGQSGVVHAADAETGEDRWSFQVVADGFWGNPDVNSGGGVWYPAAVDTEAGLTIWGTGNPAPFPGTEEFPNGSSRPGPNLHSSSVIALDSESGELEWYFQAVEHDLFDHDFQAPPILATVDIDGEARDIVIGAGKVGDIVGIDPSTQEALWRTEVGIHQNDDLDELPPGEEIEVYPGILGGVETPMAYADGVVYAAVVNIPTTHTATGHGAADGTEALANADAETPVSAGTGEFYAVDASNGEVLWRHGFDSPVFAGATVSNDLVFTATFDGLIHAFDRASGEVVWTFGSPAGINAWPAIANDTILWPAGTGQDPQLLALRLGATSAGGDDGAGGDATDGAAGDDGMDDAVVEVALVAQDNSFDTDRIEVEPGATVQVTVDHRDPVPHNFAVYRTDAAEDEIFVGETFTGPDASRTYEFTAPTEPGEYFFRCDIHPNLMTGVLVVQ